MKILVFVKIVTHEMQNFVVRDVNAKFKKLTPLEYMYELLFTAMRSIMDSKNCFIKRL